MLKVNTKPGFGYLSLPRFLYTKIESLLNVNKIIVGEKELDFSLAFDKITAAKKFDEDREKKLYVGNLGCGVGKMDLIEYFGRFGKVEVANLVYKKDGNSKDFGFVKFEKKEAA